MSSRRVHALLFALAVTLAVAQGARAGEPTLPEAPPQGADSPPELVEAHEAELAQASDAGTQEDARAPRAGQAGAGASSSTLASAPQAGAASSTSAPSAAAPKTDKKKDPAGPVLMGSSKVLTEAPPDAHELLVFKSTLFNEFTYRAILDIPADAQATPQTAHKVVGQLATFLRKAGYDLAKVTSQIKGDQIFLTIDEGALDKIILIGGGAVTALRFRAAINLPSDVFNRRMFAVQMPKLARQFGFRSYRFELWPVHMLDEDNAAVSVDDLEELRAMPLIRAARGYELRIFAETNPWSPGLAPEVIINGRIGVGLGGRYRWANILQEGDRWSTHFRVGGALRSYLDPNNQGSRIVNTNDLIDGRWLSKSWGGTERGLRMTIQPRFEIWALQRRDLMLEHYALGTMEFVTGAGSKLLKDSEREFDLFFNLGWQRRWIFGVDPSPGATLPPDVQKVPSVSNRAFLRVNSNYVFNPTELRQDLRDLATLQFDAYRPTVKGDSGYLRLDVQVKKLFAFGWNELRLGARLTGEVGDVQYVDEVSLEDHFRIGFGLEKYTHRVTSLSTEFRYSLLRDKFKVGLFNDIGVWRHLPRDDGNESAELAGSAGAGAFFFILDELIIDVFYGVGWSTDSFFRNGLALQIKEAF